MSHSNLTRWIETAEARHFYESAVAEGKLKPTETQYLHLGKAIVRIGSHALAYLSRPLLPSIHQ
jgi:hypothetical protein